MYDSIRNILESDEFSVVERFEIPGKSARFGPIPSYLSDSDIGSYLGNQADTNGWEGPLWTHQAQALEILGRGENCVVSTGTASGKSLIFQSLAFHKINLQPDSRVLVFYPQKALAADQAEAWKKMARSLGFEEEVIGRIDGSVPGRERENILERSRIIVMTPDVFHAWVMSRLSLPVIRDFLMKLSTIVMDEAHTLEGVFGSSFAFLIRRLTAARNHLLRAVNNPPPLQHVAATATIKNPGDHMRLLTGSDFAVVGNDSDGAQRHERIFAHIACPVGEEILIAKALQDRVLRKDGGGGFITFMDSRKGVEGLAMVSGGEGRADSDLTELLKNTEVLPYRAGYDPDDRSKIEQRLRSGTLKGVVSTSALELGIDIPHLCVGFNIGVPGTRKAYRQRSGRVGRSGPGVFVLIAPSNAFSSFGTTFRQYHDMSVESSYLYLDNRFMQFAHGRCLSDELESLGAPSTTPSNVDWPRGFKEMHAAARPGGGRPREYDAVAALGGDTPQYGYPLRNVCELNFTLRREKGDSSIGDINQLQALRECYPGATYLHLTKPYEVVSWNPSNLDPFIRLKPTNPGRSTRPRIKRWINASVIPGEILENHVVGSKNGFFTECQMLITERVEGYVEARSGKYLPYQDLQQRNPNMRARSRNLRTSGVVLWIDKDWFKDSSARGVFVDRLNDVILREYSIGSQDVGSAASNISVQTLDFGGLRSGSIAIYDETYGSLRLTERVYLEFEDLLSRVSAAVDDSDDTGLGEIVALVREEVSKFSDGFLGSREGEIIPPPSDELLPVFIPGSLVCFQDRGQIGTDVEIIRPTVMDGKLMYQVKVQRKRGEPPFKKWVLASNVEPSAIADAWEYGFWNPDTEEYENKA